MASWKGIEKHDFIVTIPGILNTAEYYPSTTTFTLTYLNTYSSYFYSDADFGTNGASNSQWIVDGVNVTQGLRKFRQVTIEGAQMRKYLSNSRVLSSSYIFLLSFIENCVILTMPPNKQRAILTSIQEQNRLSPVDFDVTLACRAIQLVLVDRTLSRNEVEDALDTIKRNYSSNNSVVVVLRIVYDFLTRFLHNNTSNHRTQGEATLIIDSVKPYLMH